MKKLLLIGIIATALFACNTDKNDDPLLLAYPIEVISVFPATDTTHLTPLQIVKEVSFRDYMLRGHETPISCWTDDYEIFGHRVVGKDTVNMRLNMNPDYVYAEIDTLSRALFVNGSDAVFTRVLDWTEEIFDTIAYIPNEVMRKAAIDIRLAYKTNDRDQIRKVASQAYRCYAITGKEWRALNAQGKN